jgi:calcineurin-like phosphoesterase family protein
LPFLNGCKILIVGNHDPFFKKLVEADPRSRLEAKELGLKAGFTDVFLQHQIELPGIGLVRLAHFPYAPPNQDGLPAVELRYLENRPSRGKEKLLLHGHVHSQWLKHSYPGLPPMLNVGIDMWGMRPVAEAEIVEKFRGLL